MTVFLVKDCTEAHVVSREDKLITSLSLCLNQIKDVLLTSLHLSGNLVLWNVQNGGIEVPACSFETSDMITLLKLNITVGVDSIDAHVDAKVSGLVLIIVEEAQAKNFVALWSKVEVINIVSDDLSSQVDHILLLVLLLVGDLIDLEVKLAFVDGHESSVIVTAGDRVDALLGELTIEASWEDHVRAHQVVHNAPYLALVRADADEELAILRVREAGDASRMIMLDPLIVPETAFVQLDDSLDILGLLELLALLQILQAIGALLHVVLGLSDVLLEDTHSLLPLTHRDEKICVECFTLTGHTEDEFLHLLDQLLVGYAARAPPVHAVVALRVKVAV